MGFYEDDRIRQKNAKYNQEFNIEEASKKAIQLLMAGNYNDYMEIVNIIRKSVYNLPPLSTDYKWSK